MLITFVESSFTCSLVELSVTCPLVELSVTCHLELQVTRAPLKTPEFEDTKVQPNKEYEYRVKAINEAGPSGPSVPTKPICAKPAKGLYN